MQYHNSTDDKKIQGVLYNTEFGRWEYYGRNQMIRRGEPRPGFVSADYEKCVAYMMTVEGKQ